MSKSGLFAHFKSKEQLQLQTLEHARQRFIDVTVRPALAVSRGEKRVRELFEGWLRWENEVVPGGCIFITGSIEFDDQPGPMRDALVARPARLARRRSPPSPRPAVSEGDFRADLDPQQFAFELQSLTLGFHHYARLLEDEQAEDRVRTAFESILDRARAR